jgi:hypothetical protein
MSFTQKVPHLSGSMVHVYIGLNLWGIPTEKAGKITCILNITKVSFNIGGVNRLNNKVSGKGKRVSLALESR